ncbi:patatin-like phospholipase family protein [Marinicella rhabdoformis]|uniref:patatin-like phospholipase family protein n=1 Tax=Marinicella rhabdoformis TaxID=2580566 RepID=UPI0012AEB358|nr:patatin-like phospholipase family protein [Marinicella rhabdoformis]
MRPGTTHFLILLALLLTCSSPSLGHDQSTNKRPKIGLALSGGGARGLAHIGVLRALEEKQIPIDYIAGTSMGSIVGGLYATGMSPNDLEWVVHSIDWEDAMNPSPKRQLKNYRQRQVEKDYIADLEIGIVDNAVKTGTGIASDHKIMLELQRIVGSFQTQNFDDFPVPFRAITTDLNAGEPYIIDHGDLAMAMRASMAVPLLFGPVKHHDRMLADGGILNNLPVNVVKDMGADIVIAVNISSPLNHVDENSSLISVTYQSIDVSLVQNTKVSAKHADILITPDLKKLTSSDFTESEAFANLGYLATYLNSSKLEPFRVTERQYLAHLESRNFLPREIPSTIQFVEFNGNERTATERLQNSAKSLIGKAFDAKEIQVIADAIVAHEEDIQVITYHIKERDNKKGINFTVKEKLWGPDYLKFGLQVADDFDSNTRFSLLVRHQRHNINTKGATWSNALSLGSEISWQSQLYQPLDFKNKYFATADLILAKDNRRYYKGIKAVGEYDLKEYGFGIGLGYNPSETTEWRAGLWYKDESVVATINSTAFNTAVDQTVGIKINYGNDTLEKAVAPRFGHDITTELGVFDRVQWISFNGYQRLPMLKRSALHLSLKTTLTHLTDDDEYFLAMGGINDFAGYPTHSLLGLNAFIAEVGWFTELPMINLPVIGSPDFRVKTHWGNVWQRHINLDDMKYGVSSGISFDVLDTVLFLGTGYSRGGDVQFYLRIGTGF